MDYRTEFPGADHDAWLNEYEDAVLVHDPFAGRGRLISDHETESWSAFDVSETVPFADEWAEP